MSFNQILPRERATRRRRIQIIIITCSLLFFYMMRGMTAPLNSIILEQEGVDGTYSRSENVTLMSKSANSSEVNGAFFLHLGFLDFSTISIIPHNKETKGALVSLSLSFFLSFFLSFSLSLSLSLSLFSKEKPLAWAFIVFFERARMSQHDLYLGQGFRFVLSLAIVSRFSL